MTDPLIYAITNQKGGVGKTTTAINLAATLAQAGERVLLVDADPQGNASTGLGIRARDGEPSLFEVLMGEVTLSSVIRRTVVPNLYLVPSSADMAGAAVMLPQLDRREYRLKGALAALGGPEGPASAGAAPDDDGHAPLTVGGYSYVFIDCPPSLGLLTVNALVAADQVIVPVQAEYYALEGMAQLLETVEAVRQRLNPPLRVGGLVLTMVDVRTNLAREVEDEVRRHFPDLTFRSVIPRNVRLAEAPSHGVPVFMLDPGCPGADAYFDLAAEVAERA